MAKSDAISQSNRLELGKFEYFRSSNVTALTYELWIHDHASMSVYVASNDQCNRIEKDEGFTFISSASCGYAEPYENYYCGLSDFQPFPNNDLCVVFLCREAGTSGDCHYTRYIDLTDEPSCTIHQSAVSLVGFTSKVFRCFGASNITYDVTSDAQIGVFTGTGDNCDFETEDTFSKTASCGIFGTPETNCSLSSVALGEDTTICVLLLCLDSFVCNLNIDIEFTKEAEPADLVEYGGSLLEYGGETGIY